MSNLGTDDIYIQIDSKNRTSGSIQNARFYVEKIANCKYIEVLDLQFFNIQYTIDNRNRYVYFTDAGGATTSTLTKGRYDGDTLATEIQTQLNTDSSGYTVSFSDTTLKLTISNASAFVLNTATTTTSAWLTMGFDTDADTSSATSHISDNMVKLSSKYYYITSNIVNSTHINNDLRDNILLIFSNTSNFGSLIYHPPPQKIPAADNVLDYIKLALYDDSDTLVDCNGIGYSLLLKITRG